MMPHPQMVLRARAEARGYLWRIGEFDADEATAPLYVYAVESGLVDEIGAEACRMLIEIAFEG